MPIVRLPLLPVLQPLLGGPVLFLPAPEKVSVDERAWPAPLRRELVGGRVELEAEAQRHRGVARGLYPSLVPGEPSTGVIAEDRHVPANDSLPRPVNDQH